jgi:hypothetical protein
MGILRVTNVQICSVLALVGACSVISGVAVLAGVAWALIAVGVLTLAAAFVLYDPKARK